MKKYIVIPSLIAGCFLTGLVQAQEVKDSRTYCPKKQGLTLDKVLHFERSPKSNIIECRYLNLDNKKTVVSTFSVQGHELKTFNHQKWRLPHYYDKQNFHHGAYKLKRVCDIIDFDKEHDEQDTPIADPISCMWIDSSHSKYDSISKNL